MPTRVERLEKRKAEVRKKALSKVAKAKAAGKPATALYKGLRADRKLGKLNKKITKTKARVAKRAVKKVEKLQERKARVINKGTRGKSQAKSNAKIKAAVAKGKTKKAARIDKRQINKNMKAGFAIGKKLKKISKKIVKAGGPATVIKTGKKR